MIGPITRGMKQAGKRSAGNPHAAFDVAGAGNVTMVAGLRSTTKVMELPPVPNVRAPALDPTDEREQETEPSQTGLRWRGESQAKYPPGDYSHCACSRLYSSSSLRISPPTLNVCFPLRNETLSTNW